MQSTCALCTVHISVVHTKYESKNTFERKKHTPLDQNIPALNNLVETLHFIWRHLYAWLSQITALSWADCSDMAADIIKCSRNLSYVKIFQYCIFVLNNLEYYLNNRKLCNKDCNHTFGTPKYHIYLNDIRNINK